MVLIFQLYKEFSIFIFFPLIFVMEKILFLQQVLHNILITHYIFVHIFFSNSYCFCTKSLSLMIVWARTDNIKIIIVTKFINFTTVKWIIITQYLLRLIFNVSLTIMSMLCFRNYNYLVINSLYFHLAIQKVTAVHVFKDANIFFF